MAVVVVVGVVVAARSQHLHAVAVVDVPVHNQQPLDAEALPRDSGGDGHVVEQTEPHRLPRLAVVAGRAHDGQRVVELAGGDARDELDDRTRRE